MTAQVPYWSITVNQTEDRTSVYELNETGSDLAMPASDVLELLRSTFLPIDGVTSVLIEHRFVSIETVPAP